MKVLNLRCANGHAFEGWFASEDDFVAQTTGGSLACPLCLDTAIARLPSAPRLNLSGAREPVAAAAALPAGRPAAPVGDPAVPATASTAVARAVPPPEVQAAWLSAVRQVLAQTEDVGRRFAEEARRIHYGEVDARPIRGQATPGESEALREEGIEVMPLLVPKLLEEPLQ